MSVKDFDQYKEFAADNLKTITIYFAKLMLVLAFAIAVAATVKFNRWINIGEEFLEKEIPEFNIVDGNMEMEEGPLVIESENFILNYIIINPNATVEEEIEQTKQINSYKSGALFLKDKVLVKLPVSDVTSSEYWFFYRDMNIENMTKQEVLDQVNIENRIIVSISFVIAAMISSFIIYFIRILIDIILLALFGYIISRLVRIPLKFTATLSISVYSLTLPVLLSAIYMAVNIITGYEVKYFSVMYNCISYIYLITAILLIKSDIIKRNIELTAIMQEEQRIREEMERRKQEEEIEKHRQEKEKEREQKRKKGTSDEETEGNSEKEKGKGEAPEGSKA